MFKVQCILFVGVLAGLSVEPHTPNTSTNSESTDVLKAPVDVDKYFVASGFMGDGEKGKESVQIRSIAGEKPRAGGDQLSIKVSYKPGAVGWGGAYWLHLANNWGDSPGRSIKGASKLTFWAAGEKGGEIVEFKSGGVAADGKKYKDSFEATLGKVALQKDWRKYEIDLKAQKLSNVIGGFAWVASRDANPSGVTFYLAEIRFE